MTKFPRISNCISISCQSLLYSQIPSSSIPNTYIYWSSAPSILSFIFLKKLQEDGTLLVLFTTLTPWMPRIVLAINICWLNKLFNHHLNLDLESSGKALVIVERKLMYDVKKSHVTTGDVTKTSMAIWLQPRFLTCISCEKILSNLWEDPAHVVHKKRQKAEDFYYFNRLVYLSFCSLISVQILSFGGVFK